MVFNEEMMAVLNILIIFLKLKEKIGESSRIYSSYCKIREDNEDMFEYLEKCLLSIEISDFNNEPQTVIFPKHPVFSSLSDNLRDSIMNDV